MGGVDCSHQLRSYYNTCRPSRKWYRYIFWFIFEVVLGNAFIIDNENVNRPGRRTVREFRLHLAKQPMCAFSSRPESRKPMLKAAFKEPCVSPDNAVRHFISRREGNTGKRQCVQRKRDGQKTECNRAKETIYECTQCGVALCKHPCFIYLMYEQESNQPLLLGFPNL